MTTRPRDPESCGRMDPVGVAKALPRGQSIPGLKRATESHPHGQHCPVRAKPSPPRPLGSKGIREIPVKPYDYSLRGVAQLGSAGALGALGRRFESCRPDLSHSKGSRGFGGPSFLGFWGRLRTNGAQKLWRRCDGALQVPEK